MKQIHRSLYRSTDEGTHWDLLTDWLPPALAPPAPGPDGLLVPQIHHRVAAAVDEAYAPGNPRKNVTGYLQPPYLAPISGTGATLVEDFEPMRLEVRSGKVRIAAYGQQMNPTLLPSDAPSPDQDTPPAHDRDPAQQLS